MQKVLRKRILRDLRENKFRYLALAVLIIMSMYLVISLVGAAETIMQGGESPTVNTGLRMESFPYLCRSQLQNERS